MPHPDVERAAMHIKEAAARVGTSDRMLRHYEEQGLLEPHRSDNGYRSNSEADVRRAIRIRDLIAIGFSTREVRALAPCLSDEGAGACESGLVDLERKLEHIDNLRADLDRKRAAVLQRMADFRAALSKPNGQGPHADAKNNHALLGRLSGRAGQIPSGADPDPNRT
jgi:DNA-binding transcriptional MerR regulator